MKYRSEIDGLRALAVIPVVLFHAGIESFSGGYIGVDVFFVISGYLITTLILQDLEQGRFSILEFYERRARRLLPALFLVLIVSCILAIVWMPPNALTVFGRDLIAVSLFASNIVFWRTSNYFSARAEENPLLHMWSLAVEEQFYILFPLLMLLLWRAGSLRLMITAFFLLFAGSLAISEWGWRNSSIANFFLLPPRVFELVLGAACALLLARRTISGNNLLALAGLALIGISIVWFDQNTPFPSLMTLAPIGGTGLVILFARPSTIVGRILATRPIVFVGLISYSTYLWHQPLFAFARIRLPEEPDTIQMLGLSGAALLLGWLTWSLVERPFRKSVAHGAEGPPARALNTRGQLFTATIAGLTIFIGIGGGLLISGGLVQRYDPADHHLLSIEDGAQGRYVRRNFARLDLAPFPENGRPNILVIGDSHAQDFMNVIVENGLEAQANLSSYYMPPRCSNLYIDRDISNFINPGDRAMCRKKEGYTSPELHARMFEADTIMIVASWRPWNPDFIGESFRNIARHTHAKLVLVGRKSFGPVSISRFLRMSQEERKSLRLPVSDSHLKTNARMRQLGLNFIDLHKIICDNRPDCPNFTKDLKLISHDGGHLTRDGAIYVGRALLEKSDLFRDAFGLEPQ